MGIAHESLRDGFTTAVGAAVAADRLEDAERALEQVAGYPRGRIPPFLRAQLTRGVALVAGARGENEAVEDDLLAAERDFGELGYPYWAARAQLDRAESLASQGGSRSRRGSPTRRRPPSSRSGRTDGRPGACRARTGARP